MSKKKHESNLQSLIYNLYWCNKVIKKLKEESLNTTDDSELYMINGNLKEYKWYRLDFLRKIEQEKKLYKDIRGCNDNKNRFRK